MPTRGYRFDASRMASYKFSLRAWDGGDPARNSPPVKINCLVVPQNRHSPVFKKKMYIGRVKQGEVNSNIVQVCMYMYVCYSAHSPLLGLFGTVADYIKYYAYF